MIMRRPPTEHEEWLEEQDEPKKRETPPEPGNTLQTESEPSGAQKRFEALNEDIQEFG